MKKCSCCLIEKYTTDFYKNRSRNDGLSYICKICTNVYNKTNLNKNREKYREYFKNYQRLNPNKNIVKKQYKRSYRAAHLKSKYNLTLEDYNIMLHNQNNACMICKVHEINIKGPLQVDHCHLSNKIRGLLCPNCNKGLGSFKDNVSSLKEACLYLEKYR